MQHHNDVFVVLFNLFPFDGGGGTSGLLLLGVSLQLSNLLVKVGDILLDDESEFLERL